MQRLRENRVPVARSRIPRANLSELIERQLAEAGDGPSGDRGDAHNDGGGGSGNSGNSGGNGGGGGNSGGGGGGGNSGGNSGSNSHGTGSGNSGGGNIGGGTISGGGDTRRLHPSTAGGMALANGDGLGGGLGGLDDGPGNPAASMLSPARRARTERLARAGRERREREALKALEAERYRATRQVAPGAVVDDKLPPIAEAQPPPPPVTRPRQPTRMDAVMARTVIGGGRPTVVRPVTAATSVTDTDGESTRPGTGASKPAQKKLECHFSFFFFLFLFDLLPH
jgi:hypothetical protein